MRYGVFIYLLAMVFVSCRPLTNTSPKSHGDTNIKLPKVNKEDCGFYNHNLAGRPFSKKSITVAEARLLLGNDAQIERRAIDSKADDGTMDTVITISKGDNEFFFLQHSGTCSMDEAVLYENIEPLCNGLRIGTSRQNFMDINHLAFSSSCDTIRVLDNDEQAMVTISFKNDTIYCLQIEKSFD